MADWSGSDYAVVIASLTSTVVTLVGLYRLGRKVNGLLDARVNAAEDAGDLRGRHALRSEQAERRVVAAEAETHALAAGKQVVRDDAEADAQSQANVRAIENGATVEPGGPPPRKP